MRAPPASLHFVHSLADAKSRESSVLLQPDLQGGQIYFILGKYLLQSESRKSQTSLPSYLMPDPQIGGTIDTVFSYYIREATAR